jgi:hypothetical protein
MGLGDRLAGDVDYGRSGEGYVTRRRTDPRIARLILSALGPSRTVLNVGAGAGSYEPADRDVIALEPSQAMLAQRPAEARAVGALSADLATGRWDERHGRLRHQESFVGALRPLGGPGAGRSDVS